MCWLRFTREAAGRILLGRPRERRRIICQKVDSFQKHSNFFHALAEELSTTIVPWPFHQWGMDILGPFPQASGQVKFLVVAIDYFTKWIKAEHLATITSAKIQKFFYKNIVSRFGVPRMVITDNGTQFFDKGFRVLLEGLHIKQRFTSMEHPQDNGQAEAANKVIL